jgi:hypothetical protein
MACGPHEFKQVVDSGDPGGGKGFEYLIVDVVRARLGAIGESPDTGLHQGALHEMPHGFSCVLHGLCWGVNGVRVQGAFPGLGGVAVVGWHGWGVEEGGEVLCEYIGELVGLSMELPRGGVPEDGGGRGFVMILEYEPVGVLGFGGQPVSEGLLGCSSLLLLVCSGHAPEVGGGRVDGLVELGISGGVLGKVC